MAVLRCKMCGGNLEILDKSTVCECEYCGTKQTIPILDSDKKTNLFTRANRLRSNCEFDKAYGVYESIVAEFPEEAEAYWGLVLCTYGIEYVDDPKTGKKIPTCHRSSFTSVMDDSNFEMSLEYSDEESRRIYREEAKAIEKIRKGIVELSSGEEPYDIFLCYKETDKNGDRTLDSVLGQDIYDALVEKGYKVFFSRITLEDKLGQEYEPYIFSALHSSKVMLVIGTDYENFNAVWVRNEWSRFLSLIEQDNKKTLIPCYKGIDAYDLPKEFSKLQAQDLGKLGAVQDLVRGIGKILDKKTNNVTVQVESTKNKDFDIKAGTLLKYNGESDIVIIPSNVKYIDKNAFKGMSIKEITIPSSVGSVNAEIFNDFSSLEKVIILDGIVSIEGSAFENCTSLREIVLPSTLESIGAFAFENCISLNKVALPVTVKKIGENAFYGCSSLKKIMIPEKVTKIEVGVFNECTSLDKVKYYLHFFTTFFNNTTLIYLSF